MINKIIKFIYGLFYGSYVPSTSSLYPKETNYEKKAGESLITVTYSDESVKQFIGSSTVWYEYPKIKRCDTYMESWLSDIETYHEFKSRNLI